MRYMVIERYLSGPGPVYKRVAESGRMLPDGLTYVNSWVVADAGMDRCFQLMETSDPALFDAWTERWADLVSFEIFYAGRSHQSVRAGAQLLAVPTNTSSYSTSQVPAQALPLLVSVSGGGVVTPCGTETTY